MNLLVIKPPWQITDTGWHPLTSGDPPEWAEGWGQTDGYVYVEVADLRFVWCVPTDELGYGLWFCETPEGQISAELSDVGVRVATKREISLITLSSAHAFRVEELERIERHRLRSEESERALREDMLANPEKWKKVFEEAKKREEEMKR